MSTQVRGFYEIADEIKGDWKNISPYAEQYLEAMFSLENPAGMYYADTAKSVVLYFLSNASSWRGEVARRIKAELKELVK
jgi:hypothetical protein